MTDDKSNTTIYKHKNICVSSITDTKHKHNKVRSQLLELLFCEGYDINTDADHDKISLDRIHSETVIPSDAFVLLPIARGKAVSQAEKDRRMKELFKASSLVVGLQTDDPYMHIDHEDLLSSTKPIIIIDEIDNKEDQTWSAFHDMLHGLHKAGTVKSPPETLVTFASNPQEVIDILRRHVTRPPKIQSISNSACNTRSAPVEIDETGDISLPQERRVPAKPKPEYNVCVFLSASSENEYFIQKAYDLGSYVAKEQWGLVSGAGSTSMMGSIIEGAVSLGGWTGGTTMKYIAKHEGIPPNLDQFWYNEDIYTRMKDMIEASDSFVIMPGGMGTVQELFTLLLLKHEKSPMMARADIVICNEKGFWEPLIALINAYGFDDDVVVVETTEEVIPALKQLRAKHGERTTVDTPLRNMEHADSPYNELETDGLGIPLNPY
ncbi:MAG: LOG family protein [Alphaproteobacteria bacterium]|nr:LOG family protein [Alphaproteobacteria bacterium]